MSVSWVTISNTDLLSNSEAAIKSGIRSWKKHLSDWAGCQKAIGGIYFPKKWRAETLQPGLECDNFKPRLESGIFKRISWLNGSFFWGWWSWFSERGSQDLSNGTDVASWLSNYLSVFTSIVYGPIAVDSLLGLHEFAFIFCFSLVQRHTNNPYSSLSCHLCSMLVAAGFARSPPRVV